MLPPRAHRSVLAGVVTVTFTVAGIPVPQGSKRAFKTKSGAVVMTEGATAEAAKRHKSWRAEVTDAARAVAPPEPFAGPVSVTLRFRFLPVASDPYRTYHVSSPDIDKLARSILDALKVARIVVDDSRVWNLDAVKTYAGPGEVPGVDVEVTDDSSLEEMHRRWKKEAAAGARAAS